MERIYINLTERKSEESILARKINEIIEWINEHEKYTEPLEKAWIHKQWNRLLSRRRIKNGLSGDFTVRLPMKFRKTRRPK